MKKLGIFLMLSLLFMIVFQPEVQAATASASVFASVIQPVNGGPSTLSATTPVVSGDSVNNAVALTSIEFYFELQVGASVSVVWLGQNGGVISSDVFGPYSSNYAPQTALSDYAPAGAYGVQLTVTAPGSAGGLSAAWFGQAVNTQSASTTFPAPTDTQLSDGAVSGSSGSGGSGGTTCTL